MNYYDEIKNDVMEVLEEDTNAKDILYSGEDKDTIIEDLNDYLFNCDYVTGNASGSYYFNSWKARQQCYNFASDVREVLEKYDGYERKLKLFKEFEELADEGYIDVDTMTLDYEVLNEANEDEKYYITYIFEEIEELNFETLDVITRCYMLNEVLSDVLNEIL